MLQLESLSTSFAHLQLCLINKCQQGFLAFLSANIYSTEEVQRWLFLPLPLYYYRKQQYVANWESCYDIWNEPCPQVADSDPLDIQNCFL